jgi:lipoyl(octanoyl) transferase
MPSCLPPRPVDWLLTQDPVPYQAASAYMQQHVDAIGAGVAGELVWLLEHPHLYTAGTSAKPEDLLQPDRLPVFRSGRGGQFTYHGPGQRVAYLMLDVKTRFGDVRAYVTQLEEWIIATLAELGVAGRRCQGRVGVWVSDPGSLQRPAKIAAIGVRLRRWVSSHGVSLNVSPDLSHFAGIVPCGLAEPVTSLACLGCNVPMAQVDAALQSTFSRRFGAVQDVTNLSWIRDYQRLEPALTGPATADP